MGEPSKVRIICDSREQNGFAFARYPCTVETGTLDSADYSLYGFTDRIGIERKSLADLIQSISTERDRFRRELLRLRAYDACALVVEEPQSALRQHRYRSRMSETAAWESILSFSIRLRLPVFFAQDKADAEAIVFSLLRHYQTARLRELSALTAAGEEVSTSGHRPERTR